MSIVITKQPESLVITRLKHRMAVSCDSNHTDATYQWQHQVDGTWINVPSGTTKEYSVAEWNGLDGLYRCKATKDGIYVYTNIVTAQTDKSLPVITIAAVNGPAHAVEDGEEHAHIDAGTSDSKLPLTYQWAINSKPVAGATAADFTVDHVTPDMEGVWSCEVRSGEAVAFGSIAVKVDRRPFMRIVTQPAGQTVNTGTNATFNCGVLTNVEDVKYQWFTKGIGEHDWKKMYGKTSPVLDFIATTTDNNQLYKCVLSSGQVASVESTPATLTVEGVVTVSITTQPVAVSNAIPESNVSFTVVAETNAPRFPMVYQWYKGDHIIEGAEAATYTISGVQASDAGSYKCEVYGGKDSLITAQSNAVALTVKTAPATITITHQPEAVTNCSGVPFMLMVQATESDSKQLHYQWEANGEVIPGATSSVFEIQDPSESDSGMYKCVVTSGTGAGKATTASNEAHVVITDRLPIVLTVKEDKLLDQSVVLNQMVDLTIEAVTTGEFVDYQWYKVMPVVGARPEKVGTNYHQYISFAERETAKFYCVVTSHDQVHKTKEVTVTVADNTRFLDIETPAYSVVTAQTGRQDITVHVETHDGQAPVKYVWYRANIGGTDDPIPDATSETITMHDVELNQHHIIYCEMTLDSVADGPKARSKYVHIYGSDAHVLDYHVNPLPHRNTSFMYVDYWVMDEIKNTIADGDEWIFDYKTMKYSKEVETIITAINKYGSSLLLESRNGRLEASELLVNPILG